MPAIELRDVHKAFRIPHEVHTTLTERFLSGFRGTTYEQFEALRGVNLTIESGSFVGIIGGNGSGKSTLLKIMSGLLPPDRGEVHVDGTMSALLELGLGFSNELTVRENVELYAAVLGYPRREAARRVDEAIEFAGLERFRDAKLKNLSTGMRARLGFATALQSESDIMLLDEILAVGDADFQRKCLGVFEELKARRKTMVLVSHDLAQVQRFCDEAVWLRHGVIALRGDPDTVARQYLEEVTGVTPTTPDAVERHRSGDGQLKYVEAWVENERGQRAARLRAGERATLVARAEVRGELDAPVLGFAIRDARGIQVSSDNTHWQRMRTPRLVPGATLELRATFVAALQNGTYTVWIGAADREMTTFLDLYEGVVQFVVHGSLSRDGFVDLQARFAWTVDAPSLDLAADAEPVSGPSISKGGLR